jgi:hypothetical protein
MTSRFMLTHIWDPEEKELYRKHPDSMFLTIPLCATTEGDTRDSKCAMYVTVERCLPLGTTEPVACGKCHALNEKVPKLDPMDELFEVLGDTSEDEIDWDFD